MGEMMARPMNNGNDKYSYSKNSKFQKKAIDAAKELVNKAIAEEFDVEIFSSSSNTFRISDLGCSIGPNTFLAVQNIIDAVELKCQGQKKNSLPEFQVFFNDQALNDFNHLFASLPPERKYFAAGVPGSFHGRLFPKASLHFVYSSYAFQWLSSVPRELLDKSSPAWNKGRIHYSSSTDEVVKAYEAHFAKDMDNFLNARAQEIVHGGLMALIFPCRSLGTSHSEVYINRIIGIEESFLLNMAEKGIIRNETIDSFNVPEYFATPQEVESAVKRNRCFSVKIIENLSHEKLQPKEASSTARAAKEKMIKEHFGEEIVDELYDFLYKKLEEPSSAFESWNSNVLFVLLKRIEVK